MKRSELAFTALLVPLDALMLFLAFLAAYYLRDNVTLLSPDVIGGLSSRIQYNPASTIQPYAQYLHYVAYLVPGMVAIFALTGLYSLTRTASFWQRLGKVALGVSVGLFFILLLFLFKRDFFLPRTTVLYSWLFGIVFVMAGRALIRLIQQALYRLGTGVVRVGVVGNNEAAKTLMKQLTKGWSAQYSLVKIEEDDVDGLLPHITRDQIDELIIVNEKFTVENLITLRNRCLEQHVGFGFLPRALTALQGADYTIHEELGIPVIEVKPTPLDGWGRIAKRTFDIVVSTLLIIIASPFYLLIGLVMFLTSGSPLVIRHKRIGR
ncbi:MAG TPA: hypothetical protein VLA04_06825, partial [Verrucomicrobiae bacterium]|nr:hypothetical protein [Verrucomicrobiae bacterium]